MRAGNRAEPVQIRGVLPELVVVSTWLDPYLSLKALAAYSGLSTRTLRSFINRPPAEALPCYRVTGGKLLVRRSEFDAFIAQYRTQGRPSRARVAREPGIG
ncbi:MAG: hypothetical protein A3G35_13265 [candidate division NC10 bacterium RIFCSPLOWO2_12_FULL_66_18]|nr:MAG: hypothetical protein A3G35_13265 [candidate division NC10 bacterium RIFCSPLOWO2_12_FULL_66_18]